MPLLYLYFVGPDSVDSYQTFRRGGEGRGGKGGAGPGSMSNKRLGIITPPLLYCIG